MFFKPPQINHYVFRLHMTHIPSPFVFFGAPRIFVALKSVSDLFSFTLAVTSEILWKSLIMWEIFSGFFFFLQVETSCWSRTRPPSTRASGSWRASRRETLKNWRASSTGYHTAPCRSSRRRRRRTGRRPKQKRATRGKKLASSASGRSWSRLVCLSPTRPTCDTTGRFCSPRVFFVTCMPWETNMLDVWLRFLRRHDCLLARWGFGSTDYRYESRTGPLSCFASTNSWFVTRNHRK